MVFFANSNWFDKPRDVWLLCPRMWAIVVSNDRKVRSDSLKCWTTKSNRHGFFSSWTWTKTVQHCPETLGQSNCFKLKFFLIKKMNIWCTYIRLISPYLLAIDGQWMNPTYTHTHTNSRKEINMNGQRRRRSLRAIDTDDACVAAWELNEWKNVIFRSRKCISCDLIDHTIADSMANSCGCGPLTEPEYRLEFGNDQLYNAHKTNEFVFFLFVCYSLRDFEHSIEAYRLICLPYFNRSWINANGNNEWMFFFFAQCLWIVFGSRENHHKPIRRIQANDRNALRLEMVWCSLHWFSNQGWNNIFAQCDLLRIKWEKMEKKNKKRQQTT